MTPRVLALAFKIYQPEKKSRLILFISLKKYFCQNKKKRSRCRIVFFFFTEFTNSTKGHWTYLVNGSMKTLKGSRCYTWVQSNRTTWPLQNCTQSTSLQNWKIEMPGPVKHLLEGLFFALAPQSMWMEATSSSMGQWKYDVIWSVFD